MIILKEKTQKAEHFKQAYKHAINNGNGNTLRAIYKSYSYAKERAFNDCLTLKSDLNGRDAVITGFNCDKFNYAFLIDENGATYLIYITAQNVYKIKY